MSIVNLRIFFRTRPRQQLRNFSLKASRYIYVLLSANLYYYKLTKTSTFSFLSYYSISIFCAFVNVATFYALTLWRGLGLVVVKWINNYSRYICFKINAWVKGKYTMLLLKCAHLLIKFVTRPLLTCNNLTNNGLRLRLLYKKYLKNQTLSYVLCTLWKRLKKAEFTPFYGIS